MAFKPSPSVGQSDKKGWRLEDAISWTLLGLPPDREGDSSGISSGVASCQQMAPGIFEWAMSLE